MAKETQSSRRFQVGFGKMITPMKFWISYRDHPKYKGTIDYIEEYLKLEYSKPTQQNIPTLKEDMLVAVDMGQNGQIKWVRGEITRLYTDMNYFRYVNIFLTDYGSTLRDVKVGTHVRRLEERLEKYEPAAVTFTLANLVPMRPQIHPKNPNLLTPLESDEFSEFSLVFMECLLQHAKNVFVESKDTPVRSDDVILSGTLHIEIPHEINEPWYELKCKEWMRGVSITEDGKKMVNINRCLMKNEFAKFVAAPEPPKPCLIVNHYSLAMSTMDHRRKRNRENRSSDGNSSDSMSSATGISIVAADSHLFPIGDSDATSAFHRGLRKEIERIEKLMEDIKF